MHVLDWSKIAEINNNKQSAKAIDLEENNIVNKGILFENVVEKLLSAMFPTEIWKRTKESHDGKRDFVYPAEEYSKEQKWAECKNYSSNLSINVIAPTLIMGAIEGIEYIFFFSYSPLNNTAIENILNYSEMKQSTIKIIDGNVLESLICKHHKENGIEEFFPNTDFEKARIELEKNPIRIVKTLYDLNGCKIPSTHHFELGELFYCQITIQNLMWQTVDCEVSFRVGNQQILRCNNEKYTDSIPSTEIRKYSILCEALTAGNTSCIVEINTNIISKKEIIKVTVIDEPYLAWSGEDALKAQKDGMFHLEQKSDRPLIFVGESGTGKSTLIEILLQKPEIRDIYRILKIDLSLTRSVGVRYIFSQIFEMRANEITTKEQHNDDDIALSLLVNNYAESAAMIACTLMKFYECKHPYLIVIDNIQKITRPYLSMLNELDEQARKNNYHIYYMFVLNDKEMSLNELLSELNWDINYQNRECNIIKTSKFKTKDILAYMKTRYGLTGIEEYLDGLDKEVSPLDLHTFCIGLKNDRVISKIPNEKTYQIIQPFQFREGVQQLLFKDISLNRICAQLDRMGKAVFMLKYLYIAGSFTPKMIENNNVILRNLITQGILKEKEGTIIFYHNKIREQFKKEFVFSPEDYADIFDEQDLDNTAKAICALEQIGHLRNGNDFLNNYFISKDITRRVEQKYQICWLIFEHMKELSDFNLLSAALQFVRVHFSALREEHTHKKFFAFLKHIADSAFDVCWDINENSVENMAFFIKKFFDRALSTHNDLECQNYFLKYEKIFKNIKNVSGDRRYFWLTHYANRSAIALDRKSSPLTVEPDDVKKNYELSKFYSNLAGKQDQLILQITVDDFYRHYVYRHNLTLSDVSDILKKLNQLKDDGLTKSIVLNYHSILLEYMQNQMLGDTNWDREELLDRIRNLRQKCDSVFYSIKLYQLELTILCSLRCWSEVDVCLDQALAFAYKKELRSYIYKLNYIKMCRTILEKGSMSSTIVYHQSILVLEQMLDTHRSKIQNLNREVFLLIQLLQIITKAEADKISGLFSHYSPQIQDFLNTICSYIQGKSTSMNELFCMKSYFEIEELCFPTI